MKRVLALLLTCMMLLSIMPVPTYADEAIVGQAETIQSPIISKAARAPQKITILPTNKAMNVGDTLDLNGTVAPASASQKVKWKSSNTSIATVSSTGKVTARKVGTVKITCAAAAKTAVRTIRTIKISDPYKPTGISYTYSEGLFFPKGATATLTYTVKPSTARTDAVFTTTNKNIVAVNATTGEITCNGTGIANITVQAKGTTLKDTVRVTVLNAERSTDLPDRYSTSTSEIKGNLAKIDALRESAYNEIQDLQGRGTITSGEAKLRRDAITEVFANFGYAWKTPELVKYWNSSLAQNNFLPGRIYYGTPYIQCGKKVTSTTNNYLNRQYNLAKAVTQGYFSKVSGTDRFYQMTSKRLNEFYVGCDCSSLVSIAIWGHSHPASYYNTTAIAQSSYYETLTNSKALRTGDILVKSGSHVIMFLYYLDSEKTQMMLIENSSLTVWCQPATVNSYLAKGYVMKRPAKF